MNKGRRFRAVTVAVLMALVCLPGKASAAQVRQHSGWHTRADVTASHLPQSVLETKRLSASAWSFGSVEAAPSYPRLGNLRQVALMQHDR
jgi:hypothetical protein